MQPDKKGLAVEGSKNDCNISQPHTSSVTRDRCHDFLRYFRKNSAKKLAFLTQNKAELF
jgi:hypothetical protein